MRIFAFLIVVLILVLTIFSWQTNRRESKSNFEAAPSGGRLIQAADMRVFIQEMGPENGAPVLLVHGTGAWSEIWRETMEQLAMAGFRAIAIDVPPFGYSDKPHDADSYTREKQAKRIVGILDALGIDKADLAAL